MLQLEGFKNSLYSNLGIVYGNAMQIDEDGKFNSFFFETDSKQKILQKRTTGNIYETIIDTGKSYCSITAMTKKNVYDKLNGYDEELEYEDFDFWIRASRIFEIDYIDEILVKKRIVKNSLGTNFDKQKNKINFSTYLILKKASLLNKTKTENKLLLKRVHYEMINSYKTRDIKLLLKYIPLELKLRFS
jgi:hypothetical protein